MHLLLCASLAIGVALAAPGPLTCSTQTIKVDTQWSLPSTAMAGGQSCYFNFQIPSDSYVVVEVNTKNAGYSDSVYINDDFGETIGKMTRTGVWSSSLAWPGNVQVYIMTPGSTTLQLEINLTVKKATPLANANHVSTSTNSPSTVLYFNDWTEGTSYVFTSQASQVHIQAADTSVDADVQTQYANVHVYDGDNLVGTLLSIYNTNLFVSKTNKVTLYLAKKINLRGAVLITDNSNVNLLGDHYVVYAPVQMKDKTRGFLIDGGNTNTREGTLTIIGDKDGSNPITVSDLNNLDNLGGTFSVVSGGPVASHPQATPLSNAAPKRFTGNVNTIYISRGAGTVQITTTGN